MSTSDGLDQLADRLYALPPSDFVAARDEAVAAARAAGDRARAATIATFRRPTVAAWLVNLLALSRPELIEELLELAAAMRKAQTQLRGADLRELATQRRVMIGALVGNAVDLAVAAGAARLSLPTAEVEATLAAALADESVARDLSAGRLLKSVRYAGFGDMSRPALHVVDGERDDDVPDAESEKPAAARPRAVGDDVGEARRRLEDARAGLVASEAEAATATDAVAEASRHVDDVEARLMDLRRERVAANAALNEAETARVASAQAVQAARRAVGTAERAADRADAKAARRSGRGG